MSPALAMWPHAALRGRLIMLVQPWRASVTVLACKKHSPCCQSVAMHGVRTGVVNVIELVVRRNADLHGGVRGCTFWSSAKRASC